MIGGLGFPLAVEYNTPGYLEVYSDDPGLVITWEITADVRDGDDIGTIGIGVGSVEMTGPVKATLRGSAILTPEQARELRLYLERFEAGQ